MRKVIKASDIAKRSKGKLSVKAGSSAYSNDLTFIEEVLYNMDDDVFEKFLLDELGLVPNEGESRFDIVSDISMDVTIPMIKPYAEDLGYDMSND